MSSLHNFRIRLLDGTSKVTTDKNMGRRPNTNILSPFNSTRSVVWLFLFQLVRLPDSVTTSRVRDAIAAMLQLPEDCNALFAIWVQADIYLFRVGCGGRGGAALGSHGGEASLLRPGGLSSSSRQLLNKLQRW